MTELTNIVRNLKDVIYENTSQYHHSRTLVEQETYLTLSNEKHSFTFSYSLKDLMLIGALTQSSVLMTGGTDVGKTTLAKLVMNSLFGKEEAGWHKININTDFGENSVITTDYDAIVNGKTSEELYKAAPYLKLPGLITDEINRSSPKLVAKLMQLFDKEIGLPNGQIINIGHAYDINKFYQFQISAINEGDDYSGVFDIDKAMRRRTVIEIPMDIFPLTSYDFLEIIRNNKNVELKNKVNHLEEVLKVHTSLSKLPIHENAEVFLSYLGAFDFCEHSLTKNKGSIASKGNSIYHVCVKPVHGSDVICQHIKSFENELCPYIRSITPGISNKLMSVAKGFAILRSVKFAELLHDYVQKDLNADNIYKIKDVNSFEDSLQHYSGKHTHEKLKGKELAKIAFQRYTEELNVNMEDIIAAFGFVSYSKLGISPAWVSKHYQGNKLNAVNSFIRQAKEKFIEGLKEFGPSKLSSVVENGIGFSNHDYKKFKDYCDKENPWFLLGLQPFLEGKRKKAASKNELDYLYGG
jgi:MoxR-like ATPase